MKLHNEMRLGYIVRVRVRVIRRSCKTGSIQLCGERMFPLEIMDSESGILKRIHGNKQLLTKS